VAQQLTKRETRHEVLPRKRPTQGRSKKTVEKILEATRHILETEGAKALTTILVAEKSDVTVGSIYQYFPTKHAIVYSLYTSWLDEIITHMDKIISAGGKPSSILQQIFQTFVEQDETSHLSRELSIAMTAHPNLLEVEAAHQHRISQRIVALLARLTDTPEDEQLYAFAAAFYQLSTNLMDTVRDTPTESRDQLETWATRTAASALTNFTKMRAEKASNPDQKNDP